jgi:Cu(I)/Ag(I) efflux system membrane protein CusA/SilA
VLAAFVVMRWQGVNANIMSLGGIAIAIGAMVDAAVVMIENATRRSSTGSTTSGEMPRARSLADRHRGGGRGRAALFFSLLIITLSFMPVFTCRRRKGGCSRRWPSPRPTRWRRRPPRR